MKAKPTLLDVMMRQKGSKTSPTLNKADKKAIEEYYRELEKSDGFDIEGSKVPKGVCGPLVTGGVWGYNVRVKLYARMGLVRYNKLFQKNLDLLEIQRYNMARSVPSCFYITLVAKDPATNDAMAFQVKVFEGQLRPLYVGCTIARPEGFSPFLEARYCEGSSLADSHKDSLPKWPPSDDAFLDTTRFYVVKDSDLHRHSWIRLCLELDFANKTSTCNYKDLSHLRFDKVVIETKEPVEPPEERLNATWAILYIRFTHVFKRCPIKCRTIVRIFLNETTGDLTIRSSGFEKLDVGPPRRSARTRKPVERFIG